VGEAASGPHTIDVVSKLQPDVILLNIAIPGMDAVEVLPPVRQRSPATKPLMLTAAVDEARIFEALRAGAKGYLSKDASVSDLLKAIQTVHQGELWVERRLIARFFEGEASAGVAEGHLHGRTKGVLTAREQEVVRLLASSCTNKDIAQTLCISEKTVKSHLHSIFRKLKVTRRLQVILYAIQRGLG